MNSPRSQIVSDAIALIDGEIAKIKVLQKFLRAAGGYRKSATELQVRKAFGLAGDRHMAERLRCRISPLRYRSIAESKTEAERCNALWFGGQPADGS